MFTDTTSVGRLFSKMENLAQKPEWLIDFLNVIESSRP